MPTIPQPLNAAAATVAAVALAADLLALGDVPSPHIDIDPYIPTPTIGQQILVSSTSASAYTPSIRLEDFVPRLWSGSLFKLG